ncbi:MAG: flagellar motor protein MotB [Pseudomonadota bacterium]
MADDCSDMDELAVEEGAPSWMVTFADLVTLLLVFFVLLFSMSSIETERFKSVMSSIQIALNVKSAFSIPQEDKDSSLIKPLVVSLKSLPQDDIEAEEIEQEVDDSQEFYQEIKKAIKEKQLGDHVLIKQEGKRITITVQGAMLFDSGDSELIPNSLPIFKSILELFNQYDDYSINIKGHTDDRPIETVRFPSNWELSAIRATTVLRYFIDQGIEPERMAASGFADLLPIAPNDSDENRSKNRRVEFVLEKQKDQAKTDVFINF